MTQLSKVDNTDVSKYIVHRPNMAYCLTLFSLQELAKIKLKWQLEFNDNFVKNEFYG